MSLARNIVTADIIRVEKGQQAYPLRLSKVLGEKAPKALYLQGNVGLLETTGIGFCGSRKCSDKGLKTTRDCAEQTAVTGYTVISGNTAGVDLEAHKQALSSGGSTIIVIPEGINRFRIKRELAELWDWNRVLVISQFERDAPWKAYQAMARNSVIIGLSNVMIVIEADEKGGSMSAGLETLKYKTPLYVVEYQDMSITARGNKYLLDLGANRLVRNRRSGRANMEQIFALTENASDEFIEQRQASLFQLFSD